MQYPAIVYQRDNAAERYANNLSYLYRTRYQVTVIDEEPDSDIPDRVRRLPLTAYERFFVVDGLNHDVFLMHF